MAAVVCERQRKRNENFVWKMKMKKLLYLFLHSNIFLERNIIFIEFSIPQKFLFKENFLSPPHKAATHNACALVRAMASHTREANTDDERALWMAALRKDVKTLTSLLQKGVCPNVRVC